ncbi:sensor histidine kinase [Sphaerotilus uruguayifluvii]|uniref:histidine kinase n=1 Tax=Sphaerotilus uruguayifluvii TaxID=2735897 RepID=A0ABX2G7R9_9BURK|nr:ATP-binding protein [Leptothrix sp. C29]NRT58363.1 signal transduction histidine kinase [Leptothrix sp. C29]
MSANDLKHCHRRGYQGEQALERGDGSGLGLAIAAEIAERHGACLRMQSALGQGTRAALWWPAVCQ